MSKTNLFLFLEIFSREGGIQSYVKDVLEAYTFLEKEGEGITDIFLLRDGPESSPKSGGRGLKFHYFKSETANAGRIELIVALWIYLLEKRPRRVFCGHINLAGITYLCCKPLGIPYTVLTYGKEVWEPVRGLKKIALRAAGRIWTISRYSRDLLCRSNGISPEKVELLPPSVDGDRFTPGKKSPLLIEKYGLENNRIIMTVARLWSGDIYKGVDVTIRALPEILKVHGDVKYMVIGRGDDRPRLERLAVELGVSDRVLFTGFIDNENLIEHYRLADLYVMPSREGFGIVYLEALACGVPVIAGEEDGSADPLQDGETGWRVPYREPSAVGRACIEALSGKDKRCRGEWLRETTLKKFGKDAFNKRLERLLTEP